MRFALSALAALVVPLGLGCGSTPLALEPMQQRVVEAPDTQAVLVQALVILRRDFGRASLDAAANTITTTPTEFTTQRDSGSARDLYGGRSTMRRSAIFQAGRRGDAVVARIRVDVERRETSGYRSLMEPHGPFSDNPGEVTPISQDAATTAQQNTTWVKTRRDSTLERQILAELSDYFARDAVPVADSASTEEENGITDAQTHREEGE